MKKHLLLRGLLVFMMLGQSSVGAIALADSETSPSPSPEATVAPSPSPSPSESPAPTVSPSPSASPSPSSSPSPSVSPSPSSSPSPSASASPTPSPTPKPGSKSGTKADCTQTGPCDPTGFVPNYVYNVGTGLWEPADKASFVYDKASGYWLSPKYYIDKQLGWYEIIPPSQVASLPSTFITAPNVVHTALGDVVVGSTDYQLAKMLGIIPSGGSDPSISNTGPGSTNAGSVTNSNQTWFDLTNLVNVINTLDSTAKSGNVSATDNTQVGDAVSGAANVLANLINLLASAWSWSNGGLTMFMQNLFGNLNGDITLTPSQTVTGGGGSMGGTSSVSGTGPNSTNNASMTNTNSLDVNANNVGNIVNNVDATAVSGNADASKNTLAGNVTTGNATAEINIINMINSLINSGESFFGILNIFGNLNGDILFPDGFLNSALASGAAPGSEAGITTTGPGSSNTVGIDNSSTTNVSNSSNYGLANNINATAQSGSATLGSNTTAGSASTGNASTDGSTFNLVNSSIFGDNAVLVIVNVLGHWVGKIMTISGGSSTSALLTGNAQVANTGPDSTNNASVTNANTANIKQSNSGSITNNINVAAKSGDASATDNTSVGDVSTGNAKVSTGVSNIVNSVLNVKHWFGVLIINVFGDWLGDVGNNTAAGDPIKAPVMPSTVLAPAAVSAQAAARANQPALVAANVPVVTAGAAAVAVATPATGQVLAAASNVANHVLDTTGARNLDFVFWAAAGLMLLAGAMLALDRRLRSR